MRLLATRAGPHAGRHRPGDHGHDLVQVERLGKVVEHPLLESVDRLVQVGIGRHGDHGQTDPTVLENSHHCQAVRIGQPDVGKYCLWPVTLKRFADRFDAVPGDGGAVLLSCDVLGEANLAIDRVQAGRSLRIASSYNFV